MKRQWSIVVLLALVFGVMAVGVRSGGVAGALVDAGTTTRVSVDSSGAQGNSGAGLPAISADGRFVAFESDASNLVADDTNGWTDIFVHDRQSGITTRVSVATNGVQGVSWSFSPALSADGRFVAFSSSSSNFVDSYLAHHGIFVHDRQNGITSHVSVASDGTHGNGISDSPAISADGRYVAFVSEASNLVTDDTNEQRDVFVHDRQSGVTNRVSIASDGMQGNGWSNSPALSADGRYVAFQADASNLVSGDTNGYTDIFIHDRLNGTTSRVSVASDGTQGVFRSYNPDISADGRYVAFQSSATNLVPGDTNGPYHIYVHDRQTETTNRVSVSSSGAQGNSWSNYPVLSADGRYIAFGSFANNLVPDDTNVYYDIFVHDRLSGTTSRVSVDSDGIQGNSDSYASTISADGRYVAFTSWASNLVFTDTNNTEDVFIHNRGGQDPNLYSISGKVTTQNGTPLLGAVVSTAAGHTTTDATGHYTITGVPAGTYNVGPTLTGYSFTPLTRSVTVPPDATGVDFIAYLQGAYAISGKVTLQDGTPLPGVQVGAGFGHYDFTDRNGIYTIDGLDAGAYELSATLTGYRISPEFPEWQPITLPPTRNDVNFIASTVTSPALNPILNADGNGYFDVTWKSVEGASRYQLQANQNGSANRLFYEGTRTLYAASDAPFGKWCFRVRAQVNGYWSLWSAYECTDVRPPLGYIDLTISIYREVLDKDRDAYENILRHFADAIYEMTNGAQRVRVVRIYQLGENANTANVRWVEKAWPSARLSGVTIPGHQVEFADTLDFGSSKVNALVWDQQLAGYTLAHEWGHYYYGLKDEYRDPTPDCPVYCPGPNDEPVPNSVMNQQKNALGFLGVGENFNWLNFSIAKNFNPSNAQYRTYWASGWDTLKRPSEDDPQHLRRAGFTKRVYYPELRPVAPIGDAEASLQLPGGRQEARGLLSINWIVSSAGRSSHDTEPSYWAQLSALEGPEFDYPAPIVLVASAKQYALVAQAGLKAAALAPDGAEIELSFLDDGNAPDAVQNDGVYTGFLPYDQNGAYQVTVDFDNVAGAAYFTESAYEHSLGPNGETFDPATAPPPPPVSTTFSATATATVVVSGYQNDDHGNTPAASSLLSVDNKPRAGRIDYAGDVDVFKLVLPNTGATIFRVSGLALSIHPQVRILDGNGVTLLGEYEIAPEAGEYFFRPLEGNKGDTFYVRIADKHGQAAGGLYSLSAGDPLPNEIEEPSLDTSIYLPMTIR